MLLCVVVSDTPSLVLIRHPAMRSGYRSVPSSSFLQAVATIIFAIFLFDVQGTLIKFMGERYPVAQIALFRNLFGILPSLLVLYWSTQWHADGRPWKIRRWKLGLGRGLFLIVAQMCFYYSLVHMALATATTLAFAGPLFVTTLSIPLLGHTVGWWRSAAVAIGFAGVILVMQPGGDAFTVFALLPICAAFFYALSSLTARFFDPETPTAIINLYSSAGTLSASVIVVLITGQWVTMESLQDWAWFVGMGMAGGFAVFFMIKAYRMTEPSSLSPFEYFGIPFSFALGWIFFGEAPFGRLFPGALFIVCGGLLVILRERHLKNADKKPPDAA